MADELTETREALYLLCAALDTRMSARGTWAEKEAALIEKLRLMTDDVANILEDGDHEKTWKTLRTLTLAVLAFLKARGEWAKDEQPLLKQETDAWLRAANLLNDGVVT